MSTRPRYLHKVRQRNGKYLWKFTPPEDALEVSTPKSFKDGRSARVYAEKQNLLIDEHRGDTRRQGRISDGSPLRSVYNHYVLSSHFKSLAKNTQKAYTAGMEKLLKTRVGRRSFGQVRVNTLSAPMCGVVYEEWVKEGSANAQYLTRMFSVLISYCQSLDLIRFNPMAKIKKVKHEPQTVVWTKDQVEKFVTTAFEDFHTRSVGLIVLMAYEWCQRPVDIRKLKWSSVDFDSMSVTIKQQKRGATVYLPIDDQMYSLLKKQHDDFGFQEWVVPILRPSDKQWVSYSRSSLSSHTNKVLLKAGLPKDLTAGTLRKTGIGEMVEANVSPTLMMPVTGHKNIQSLNPYLRNTLEAATAATNQRKGIHNESN